MTHRAVNRFKVVKTLAPGRKGALRLAERYGEALVCVRHRVGPEGKLRITTVELVVDETPIHPRAEAIVQVRIGFRDRNARAAAMAAGAVWDAESRLWRMPRGLAHALNLREVYDAK